MKETPANALRKACKAKGIAPSKLAMHLNVPGNRITDIIGKGRRITLDTAIRLGLYFGDGTRRWAELQLEADLASAETAKMTRQLRSEVYIPKEAAAA